MRVTEREGASAIPNSFTFKLLRKLIEDTKPTAIRRNQRQPRPPTLPFA